MAGHIWGRQTFGSGEFLTAQGLPFYKWWHDVGVIDMAIHFNIH